MICFTVFAPFASNLAVCGAWCVMVLLQVTTGFANNVPLRGGFQKSPSGLALSTPIVFAPWIKEAFFSQTSCNAEIYNKQM